MPTMTVSLGQSVCAPRHHAMRGQPHGDQPFNRITAVLLMTLLLLVCRGFRLRIAGRRHAGGSKGAAQQP